MECSDSSGSDSDGHGNENDQELIIIPIKNRTKLSGEGYSTENGVTVINFDKSKHVVSDKCSLYLKSMKCLENHMKSQHNDSSYFCSECGISKSTWKQLQDHQRCMVG